MNVLLRFRQWLRGPRAPTWAERKIERWREHEVARPENTCVGHSRCWTAAPGIWHCRTCHKWYRTWKLRPKEPKRQREGW